MATAVGNLAIKLSVDSSGLVTGFARGGKDLQSFAKDAKSSMSASASAFAIGAAGAGLLLGALGKVSSYMSDKWMAGANFEKSMSKVKALSGAGAKDMELLSAEARRLGATTEFSSAQAAEALAVFAKAGMKTGDMLAALQPALNLASTGQIDIATAADKTRLIMGSLGIAGKDAAHVIDVLAMASTSAAAPIEDIGEAFKFAGSIARSAGMDIEKTVSLIALLQDARANGEMSGSCTRALLSEMAAKNKEAKAAFGFGFADDKGNFRDMADIVDDLNAKLEGMGTLAKQAKIMEVFEKRSAGDMLKLLGLGGDKIREFENKLRNSTGRAADIAATQLDNWLGDLDKMSSAAESVAESLFVTVGPGLRQWTQDVTGAIEKSLPALQAWLKAAQAMGGAMGQINMGSWLPESIDSWEKFGETMTEAGWIVEYTFLNIDKSMELLKLKLGLLAVQVSEQFKHRFGTELPRLFQHSVGESMKQWQSWGQGVVSIFAATFSEGKRMNAALVDWVKGGFQGDLNLGLQGALENIASSFKPVAITPFSFEERTETDAEKFAKEHIAKLEKQWGLGLSHFFDGKRAGGKGWFDDWLGAPKGGPAKPPPGSSPPGSAAALQFAQANFQGSREAVQAEMRWRAEQEKRVPPMVQEQKTTNKLLEQIKQEIRDGVRYSDNDVSFRR